MGSPNVFLFVPNLIGYVRILLLGCSTYYMPTDYLTAILLYSLSYVLDAFDGLAARMLNQSSAFGSMLDMLTDRVSTMCLLMTLAHLYTNYFIIFQLLLVIDIVSHWLHFFSSIMQGRSSHKSFDAKSNILLRLYYGNKFILTLVCAMEQIFFCSLLIYHHEFENNLYRTHLQLLITIGLPAIIFKNCINILQIQKACKVIGAFDLKNSEIHVQ